MSRCGCPTCRRPRKFYQQFFGMKLAQQSETIHILSVGDSFFGIEQKPDVAALDHFDFGLEGWDAKPRCAPRSTAAGLKLTAGLARRRRELQVQRSRRLRGPGQRPQIYRPCRTRHQSREIRRADNAGRSQLPFCSPPRWRFRRWPPTRPRDFPPRPRRGRRSRRSITPPPGSPRAATPSISTPPSRRRSTAWDRAT